MSQHADLVKALQEESRASVEYVFSAYKDFPWTDKEIYGNWLAQAYYYVSHATRVLAAAAARCELSEESLHRQMLKGINEEKNHELLAKNDFAALGLDLANFAELPSTTAYYKGLYKLIESDGPGVLPGYFIPLEGLAAVKLGEATRITQEAFGKAANSFLRVHYELDQDHFGEGLEFFETLTESQLLAARKGIALSAKLYHQMVLDIAKGPQAFRSTTQSASL